MKLVLFERTARILPGILTEDGVVDISEVVPAASTPQATMESIIGGFEDVRPRLERVLSAASHLDMTDFFPGKSHAARPLPPVHRVGG